MSKLGLQNTLPSSPILSIEDNISGTKKFIDLLFDLSMVAKEKKWHKTGVHLYVAAEELKNMLERDEFSQPQYNIKKER